MKIFFIILLYIRLFIDVNIYYISTRIFPTRLLSLSALRLPIQNKISTPRERSKTFRCELSYTAHKLRDGVRLRGSGACGLRRKNEKIANHHFQWTTWRALVRSCMVLSVCELCNEFHFLYCFFYLLSDVKNEVQNLFMDTHVIIFGVPCFHFAGYDQNW